MKQFQCAHCCSVDVAAVDNTDLVDNMGLVDNMDLAMVMVMVMDIHQGCIGYSDHKGHKGPEEHSPSIILE